MSTKLFELNLAGLADGDQSDVPVYLEDYQEAADNNMTFAEFFNQKYRTKPGELSAFDQARVVTGLVESSDGYRARPLGEVLGGKTELSGAIVRPDGSARNTPAGRFFFPAVFLQMAEETLREDNSSYTSAFLQMVATRIALTEQRYDQVLINYSRPRNTRSEVISQLAEPKKLLSITTSERSKSIPVWSLGMEISDQAMRAATLDLVRIAFREQAEAERAVRLEEDFMAIINGDPDHGEPGLMGQVLLANDPTLDPTLASGTISQKAWVKFLMRRWKIRTITHAVMSIDTYLKVENRINRPVKPGEPAVDERLNTIPRMMLDLIPANVAIFPMDNFPEDLIVGLDSSKAMRQVSFTGGNYQATQEYVMRRSTAFRFDHSERIESMQYPEAFELMTLATASAS